MNYTISKKLINAFCLCITASLAIGCYNASTPGKATPKAVPMKTFTNSIGMKLVYLPGGTFKMGDAQIEPPVHEVTLSPFWIGQYEVTNAEYDLFKKRARPPESLTNQQPAMYLTWHGAVSFCQWLSKKEGRRYRLPTEAEWEYAARGGLEQKKYPWGNEDPEGRATYGMAKTTPVGTYAPNNFGLYDVAGNINEWVLDWYEEDYYAHSPIFNPQGPPKGELKVTRGGLCFAFEVSCAFRYPMPPDMAAFDKTPLGRTLTSPDMTTIDIPGFRVVMEADQGHTKDPQR